MPHLQLAGWHVWVIGVEEVRAHTREGHLLAELKHCHIICLPGFHRVRVAFLCYAHKLTGPGLSTIGDVAISKQYK